MKLSVAMVTHNGAAYVAEQLASIGAQTRLPDELVVCDDGSSDSTPMLVRKLAPEMPFPVKLHSGPHVGMFKNAEHAISRCSGDLIALADQDDVWLPEKLALGEEALIRAPGAGLVFSDASVVDERLQPLGYTLWESIGFGSAQRRLMDNGHALRLLLRHNVVQGGTIIFRSELRGLVLPIPSNGLRMPDGWVALAVASATALTYVEQSVILYRQHRSQHVGAPRRGALRPSPYRSSTSARDRLLGVSDCRVLQTRLRQVVGAGPALERSLRELALSERHLLARADLPHLRRHRPLPVLREVVTGGYHRHSRGLLSAGADLLRPPCSPAASSRGASTAASAPAHVRAREATLQ